MLTLTLRVTQKHVFSVHQIITPFIYYESLKNFICQKNSMGYTKKRKMSMPKGMREKMHAKEHEEKKRKRKERNIRGK